MKVLSAGPMFGQSAAIARLFRSTQGHELRTICCQGTFLPADTPDYVYGPGERAETIFSRVCESWNPEIFVYWLPDFIPPPYGIENLPVPTVAIVSDWNLKYPSLAFNLCRFDRVIVDIAGAESLRLHGIQPEYRFPIYSHVSSVHRLLSTPRDIDVLFVGNLNTAIHHSRSQLLEHVAKTLRRWRFEIWSDKFGEDYVAIMNRARIVINYSLRGEMNLRCFEAPACGALLFVEEENREVFQWFDPESEVVAYRPENIVELLHYYLSHETIRAERAVAGNRKARALAGENRLDQIIEDLASTAIKERGYAQYAPEERLLADATLHAFDYDSPMGPNAEPYLAEMANSHPGQVVFPALLGLRFFVRTSYVSGEIQRGLLASAFYWAREACRRDTTSPVFLFNLAEVCRKSGLTDQAARLYEQVCKIDKLRHGLLLYGAMNDSIYIHWLKLLATGRESKEYLHGICHLRLARLLLTQGKHDAALDALNVAEQCVGATSEGVGIRADVFLQQGQTAHAFRVLEEALHMSPFDHELRLRVIRLSQVLGYVVHSKTLMEESERIFRTLPQLPHVAALFSASL